MKIAFVILHYLAGEDTIECIESIKNNVTYDDKMIIVVDNASTNNSFDKIEQKYSGNDMIHLIHNRENLGFARGNNVGFRYAKNILKADFIVLLNNDTIIEQRDFSEIVERKYKEHEYYVLGPDILTRDGFHQNPLNHREWTVRKLKLFKAKAVIRLIDQKVLGIGPKIVAKKQKITAMRYTKEGDFCNVRLHGACLIFSPAYIKRFDGLDEGTFLYMEEDLLQMQMDYYNLPMWYTSELKIFHKEDASTNMVDGSNKEKNIRFLKNLIHSIDVCIDRATDMRK